jgi:TolA-binding protein
MRPSTLSLAVVSAGALSLLCACQSPRQQRLDRARSIESMRLQEEQLNRMSGSMRDAQEQYGAAIQHITSMQGQIATMERRIQALSSEVESLKQQVALERQARQADMDRLLQQVAKETAAALRSASPPAGGGRSSGPATAGEFYEYTVESGATLSAIAKAYGVSIDSIRKANRMKDDNLRVGQKLYVPKK